MAADPPIPWRPVVAVCIGNAAHFYTICSLFSYGGIMCSDLGWADSNDTAGFAAGLLGSANVLGRVPSSFLWGKFVDRYGARRALVLSFLSITIGNIAFGLSTNLNLSIGIRLVLLGVCNGWVTIFNPLIYNLVGPERQVEVISQVLGYGAVVQMLGPAIGGFTYGVYPQVPALVPSAVGAGLSLLAVVLSWRWVPETQQQGYEKFPAVKADSENTEKPAVTLPIVTLFLVVALRSLVGLLNFGWFDVFPLWCIASRDVGGLDMSQADLGTLLSLSSVCTLVFTLRAMSRICKFLGLRKSQVVFSFLLIGVLSVLPFVPTWWMGAVLHVLAVCSQNVQISVSMAMTNNATPELRRGEINGIAVTCESIGKGLGPVGGANLFAWSVAQDGHGGRHVAFWALGGLDVLCLMCVFLMPSWIERGIDNREIETAAVKIDAVGPQTVGVTEEEAEILVQMKADQAGVTVGCHIARVLHPEGPASDHLGVPGDAGGERADTTAAVTHQHAL
mmetsp:Transcript_142815/g.319322  ORF Transcript_142815/g.319322 Transcript_142815/m.319322 type:complete len:505 (+) Transcript_142815:2-1516(+)